MGWKEALIYETRSMTQRLQVESVGVMAIFFFAVLDASSPQTSGPEKRGVRSDRGPFRMW